MERWGWSNRSTYQSHDSILQVLCNYLPLMKLQKFPGWSPRCRGTRRVRRVGSCFRHLLSKQSDAAPRRCTHDLSRSMESMESMNSRVFSHWIHAMNAIWYNCEKFSCHFWFIHSRLVEIWWMERNTPWISKCQSPCLKRRLYTFQRFGSLGP